MKPLDDAFSSMDVTYLRYQDDVIILCETKRQLERCKQRLMKILQERHLRLSSKKTRIGAIDKAFHFLGINYSGPQSWDGTNNPLALTEGVIQSQLEQYLASMGGGTVHQKLIRQRLSKTAWFHMNELCGMHVKMLSKWLPVEFLSNESGATYRVGVIGGCKQQNVGRVTNY